MKKTDKIEVGELNAANLKALLWQTMNELKSGGCAASQGDAIAGQAREILRTVNAQLKIHAQANKSVTAGLVKFATE